MDTRVRQLKVSPKTPPEAAAATLRVSEIFYSLQGESLSSGCPTIFIRLTGCPLRCHYCDTTYAFTGGETRRLQHILTEISQYKTRYVTVTGGEPLAQPACLSLLKALCDLRYKVSLETSGALDIAPVDPRVSRVMDLKTPSSGEEARNLYANINQLRRVDQVKFVIGDRADYDWARQKIAEYHLTDRCEVLFSAVWETLAPAQLADWILHDLLQVRLQLQLHKLLWGNTPGR